MVVSTGVGGGIVLDGRLLDGRLGNAGHIGHVVVEPDGRPCSCGGFGCLEAEASGSAIAAAHRPPSHRGHPRGRPAHRDPRRARRRVGRQPARPRGRTRRGLGRARFRRAVLRGGAGGDRAPRRVWPSRRGPGSGPAGSAPTDHSSERPRSGGAHKVEGARPGEWVGVLGARPGCGGRRRRGDPAAGTLGRGHRRGAPAGAAGMVAPAAVSAPCPTPPTGGSGCRRPSARTGRDGRADGTSSTTCAGVSGRDRRTGSLLS